MLFSVGDFFVIYYDFCEFDELILIVELIDFLVFLFVFIYLFIVRKLLIFLVSNCLDFVLKFVLNK